MLMQLKHQMGTQMVRLYTKMLHFKQKIMHLEILIKSQIGKEKWTEIISKLKRFGMQAAFLLKTDSDQFKRSCLMI